MPQLLGLNPENNGEGGRPATPASSRTNTAFSEKAGRLLLWLAFAYLASACVYIFYSDQTQTGLVGYLMALELNTIGVADYSITLFLSMMLAGVPFGVVFFAAKKLAPDTVKWLADRSASGVAREPVAPVQTSPDPRPTQKRVIAKTTLPQLAIGTGIVKTPDPALDRVITSVGDPEKITTLAATSPLRNDAIELSSALNEIVSGLLSCNSADAAYARTMAHRLGPLVQDYNRAVFDTRSRDEASEALSELAVCIGSVMAASTKGEMDFGINNALGTYWRLYTIFRESRYGGDSL